MSKISESAIEDLAIQRLGELGYTYLRLRLPDGKTPLRTSYEDAAFRSGQSAVDRLNPHIPGGAPRRCAVQRLHAPR